MVRLGSEGDPEGLARALGCRLVNLPITYLRLPLGTKSKEARMWEPVVNKYEKLLELKKTLSSKGDRLTLKKSTLSNLSIYYISLMTIPRDVAKKLKVI